MVATGYLDETERRYTLGAAPYLLNLIAGRPSIGAVPHDDLVALSQETGQPAMLAVAVGRNVFYIDSAMADPQFAYLAENHVRRPMLRTSSGWIFLAHMDRRDLWAHLQAAGPEDEQRVEDFLAEMPRIIETGICDSEKSSDTAAGVAAAVREAGRVVAAVVLIGTRAEIAAKREGLAAVLAREAPRWAAGDARRGRGLRREVRCEGHLNLRRNHDQSSGITVTYTGHNMDWRRVPRGRRHNMSRSPRKRRLEPPPMSTAHVHKLDRVVIRFAGDSGDGMQLTGDRFTSDTAAHGNDLSTLPNFLPRSGHLRAPCRA